MQAYLVHHGIKGQKWGVRRYQNEDGSLTPAGRKHIAKAYDRFEARVKEGFNPKGQKTKIKKGDYEAYNEVRKRADEKMKADNSKSYQVVNKYRDAYNKAEIKGAEKLQRKLEKAEASGKLMSYDEYDAEEAKVSSNARTAALKKLGMTGEQYNKILDTYKREHAAAINDILGRSDGGKKSSNEVRPESNKTAASGQSAVNNMIKQATNAADQAAKKDVRNMTPEEKKQMNKSAMKYGFFFGPIGAGISASKSLKKMGY